MWKTLLNWRGGGPPLDTTITQEEHDRPVVRPIGLATVRQLALEGLTTHDPEAQTRALRDIVRYCERSAQSAKEEP